MEYIGKHYALIVGCNYPKTRHELRGCINDANSMYDFLISTFGLTKSNIVLLTDEPSSQTKPTAALIKGILMEVFSIAKAGDVVFLFFAGHGTIVPKISSSTGKDEQAIVASDFNLISCIDFRKILTGCKEGVQFVIMSDSCHNGGLIDKDKEQIGSDHRWEYVCVFNSPVVKRMIPFEAILQQLGQHAVLNIKNPSNIQDVHALFRGRFGAHATLVCQNIPQNLMEQPLKAHQGILLSACEAPNEQAGERVFEDKWAGIFTNRVLFSFEDTKDYFFCYWDLVLRARYEVSNYVDDQNPCIYGDKKYLTTSFFCPSNYKLKWPRA